MRRILRSQWVSSCIVFLFAVMHVSVARLWADGQARIVKVVDIPGCFEPLPVINDQGEVAFAVTRQTFHSENGLWFVSADGQAKQILREDGVLPGIDQGMQLEQGVRSIRLNQNGQMAFSTLHVRDQTNVQAIWLCDPEGGMELVVQSGMPVPGMAGVVFQGWDGFQQLTSGSPCKLFFGATQRPVNQDPNARFIDPLQVNWIWAKAHGGELEPLFEQIHPHDPIAIRLNQRGDLLTIPRTHEWTSVLLQTDMGVKVRPIKRGEAITIGDKVFKIQGILDLVLNDQRKMCALVSLQSEDLFAQAVLEFGVEGLQLVLYKGAPVQGVSSTDFGGRPFINRHGHLLLVPGEEAGRITYIGENRQPQFVLDTRDPAAGTSCPFQAPGDSRHTEDSQDDPNGLRPWRNTSYRSSIERETFNGRGQFAFVGHLGGDANESNNCGIWVLDASKRQSHLVVRTGESITLPSGETRRVVGLSFASGSSSAQGFNERGQLTYGLQFDNNSMALVVDDRFADLSETSDDEVAEQTHEQKLSPEQARALYDQWEALADQQIVKYEQSRRDSDQYKLEQLAQSLKDEYQACHSRLALLLGAGEGGRLNAISRDEQQRALEARLRQLPLIWRALSERQYGKPSSSSLDEREIQAATLRLLGVLEEFPEFVPAVVGKWTELESARPADVQYVNVLGSDREVPHFLMSKSQRLAAFSGPLHPELSQKNEVREEAFARQRRRFLVNPPAVPGAAPGQPPAPTPSLTEICHRGMSQLVKLVLRADGRLELDRDHWLQDSGEITIERAAEIANEMLQSAGISEDLYFENNFDRQRAVAMAANGIPPRTSNVAVDRFRAWVMGVGLHSHSRSWGGDAETGTASIEGELMGFRLDVSKTSFRLQIDEKKLPLHMVTIDAHTDGLIRIVNQSVEDCFYFVQKPTGEVRCYLMQGDQVEAQSAANFGDLYRQKPEWVETKILGRFQLLGFAGPANRSDVQFRRAIIDRIRAQSPAVHEEVSLLVRQLDSAAPEERKAAADGLAEKAESYRPVLEEVLRNSPSTNVRVEVERIVEFARKRSEDYYQLSDLLGTLDSIDQLNQLLATANEEEATWLRARMAEREALKKASEEKRPSGQ